MLHRSLFPIAPQRANRLFHDSMLTPWLGDLLATPATTSALQVRETEDAYTVRLELPGFAQEEVAVELTGDVLAIRAQRKAEDDARSAGWGAATSHARSLRLKDPIDAGQVQAELKNGVLLVTLPKSEAAKPRKIAIKTAQLSAPQLEQSAESPPAATTP